MRWLFFYKLFFLVLLISCSSPNKITYFKDIPDTLNNYILADTADRVLTVKPDDVLMIHISSPNPEASSFFMIQGANNTNNSSINNTLGTGNTYLVDKKGGIDLPVVGRLLVEGLTTVQVKDAVRTKVLPYLKDPIVIARLQNFKITVLGEVNKPANYFLTNERVTILDAIGLAGDLTIYGRRENVLLIRQQEGKMKLTRLNLTSSKLFQSPYFYLEQNDVVYVEPSKSRAAGSDLTIVRNLSILTSITSILYFAVVAAERLF